MAESSRRPVLGRYCAYKLISKPESVCCKIIYIVGGAFGAHYVTWISASEVKSVVDRILTSSCCRGLQGSGLSASDLSAIS